MDESHFGARRVRNARGRGVKAPLCLACSKEAARCYTPVVKNCSISSILPIIERQADKETTVYTDGFRTYDGLADFSYKQHYRVKHNANEFAIGHNHINGIENF